MTAVLNQADALRQTIESVLAQSYPKLDYVIVDGASTDGTVEVIGEYAGLLTKWISEPDDGVYDAMNKGWAMADEDSSLLFLGAGDRLLTLPESLPAAREAVIYYGRVILDGETEFISRANWRLKLYNALHHQGLLVPKKVHPKPPFDTRYRLYADFDFNQRLLKQGRVFSPLDGLSAYAAPVGMSSLTDVVELTRISRRNFGWFWGMLSALGFASVKLVPALRRLRPVRSVRGCD